MLWDDFLNSKVNAFQDVLNSKIYIDKTGLIREIFKTGSEVTLFTRPRRFGKSLNMSMLKAFFELNSDKNCFKGTRISREVYLCEQYMGKFPVIFISLKSISAQTYEKACDMAIQIVNGEARRFQYLLDSERLTEYDKDAFKSLLLPDMKESVLCSSLRILSELPRRINRICEKSLNVCQPAGKNA